MFSLFLILIISYLSLFLIGSIAFRIFVTNKYSKSKRIFIKLFLGLFISVTFFAIIKTNGVTVNIISIILGFIIWYHNKFKINLNFYKYGDEIKDLKYLSYGLPILLLFFCYRYYTLFNTAADIPVVINMDSLKHVIRAGFLVETGIESVNVNYIIPPTGVDPYHYFEAWTIGLIGSIYNINFWVAQQVIVFPIISSMIVTGFWGITERWSTRWHIYTIGIISVIFSGLYLGFIENIKYFKYTGSFAINAFDEWKGFAVAFAYLVVLLFFNLLFSKNKSADIILFLLFLPIISITLAPTIFTIVVLLLLTVFIFRKKLDIKISWTHLITPFIIALCIFLFYKLFEPTETYIDKPDIRIGIHKLFDIATLKTYTIIVIEKIAQTILLFLPALLTAAYLLFLKRRSFKGQLVRYDIFTLIFLLFVGFTISTSFWILFYGSFGSSQFLFYTMMPFFNIISLLIIIYAIIKTQSYAIRTSLLILIVVIASAFIWRTHTIYLKGKAKYFDKYSIEYVNAVYAELKKLDNPHGLKIEHPSEFVKFNDTHHLVGNFLPGAFNNSNLVSITLGEMYLNNLFPSKEAKMLIPKAPMSVYCDYMKSIQRFESIELCVLQLIQEFNYKFIFISPKAKHPHFLEKYIKLEIIDSKSKEVFLLIN